MLDILKLNNTIEIMVLFIAYFALFVFILTTTTLIYKDMKTVPNPINYMIIVTICIMSYTIIESCMYLQLFIIYYIPMLHIMFKVITKVLVSTYNQLDKKEVSTIKGVFYTLVVNASVLDLTKIYYVEKFLNG